MSTPTNEERADRIADALNRRPYNEEEDSRLALIDLLTDLHHYAEREAIDVDEAIASAAMHYEHERTA